MLCCTAVAIRSSRSEESPTDSGFAEGRSCAKAMRFRTKKPSRTGVRLRFRPVKELERMLPPAWLRFDALRCCIPCDRLLAEIRFVGHVACNGCVVSEY